MDLIASEIISSSFGKDDRSIVTEICYDTQNPSNDSHVFEEYTYYDNNDFKYPSDSNLFKGNSSLGEAIIHAANNIDRVASKYNVIFILASCCGNASPRTGDALRKAETHPLFKSAKRVVISFSKDEDVKQKLSSFASIENNHTLFYLSSEYIDFNGAINNGR